MLKRVAVTGGAGQIAYSLLFRIANGDLLGAHQPLALHILEVPDMLKALEGVKMELEDCAFPLLKEIVIGSDAKEVFKGVHYALLVGAKPRGPGMERGDLLKENGKIFIGQGQALAAAADKDVKVLVVGNPCNTNCWIAMTEAKGLSPRNFHAMTRLDQNRAAHQLSQKAGVDLNEISHVTIWGNHSSTQVPDYFHSTIKGRPATEVIKESSWFESDFIPIVQKRGAAVIDARGKSSAASAAHAALEGMKSIITPTPEGQWYSSGVYSNGNPYGIADDLIFSFPCRTKQDGSYEIVKDLPISSLLLEKMKRSEKELTEEREIVKQQLKK